METVMEWFGPVTVGQRVAIGVTLALLAFAVLVGITAVLTGFWRALLAWIVIVAGGLAALALLPVDTDGLTASSRAAAGFEEALARFEEAADPPEALNPLCEPQLLHHGEKTDSVVVLLHGVSSCPRAFVDFAPILFERGHNVLVMRMPQNGHADRATDALSRLTAEQLRVFGDQSVDIAAGLGEDVIVLGISAGGTVAGWAAQNRGEVDRAVLVAPFYGLGGAPPLLNRILMRAMLAAPDFSIWKDPVLRENFEGTMPHAYKRQSTRATGEIMLLGLATLRQARAAPPAAGEIAVVTNEADTAVSNATTDVLVDTWRQGGKDVVTTVFSGEHGLGHELIDPLEPGADPALTYPVLVEIVEGGDPGPLAWAE